MEGSKESKRIEGHLVEISVEYEVGGSALQNISKCRSANFIANDNNMPSPFVVKLPPELLAAIFSYVTPRFEHTGPDCLLRWIRTTHVCHYWRDVAINHADLWTTVSVGPSRTSIESLYFDLCFKRSGSLPVALLCDVEDIGWIEEMLTTLVSLDVTRDKVKHLRIVGLESNIFSLFNLISRFALSTLDISTYTLDGPDEDIWLPHPPDHQFADLTTLSTAGCAFDLNSVLYGPHLTTLELRDLPTFQRLNTWQVLALIKRLPKITDLTLVDSLRSPGTLSPPTPVKTLRSLTIVDTGTPCLCLLAALIAPNLESFHVAYQSRLGSHDTLSEVLKYANGAIRSPLPYTELRLHTNGHQGEIRLGTVAGNILTARLIRSIHPLNLLELSLADLSAAGPDIYFLELRSSPETYESQSPREIIQYKDGWQTMLSKFKSIRVLRFISYRPLLLIETLFERAMLCMDCGRDSTSQHLDCFGSGMQLLSHLETIELVNFSFVHGCDREDTVNSHTRVAEYPLEELLVALLGAIKRHSPSAKLPRITFINCCNVDRRWIAELRRYTQVDCDDLNHTIDRSSERWFLSIEEAFDGLIAWYKIFEEHPNFNL